MDDGKGNYVSPENFVSPYLWLAEHPVIETDRLVLRPVTLDDAEDMYEACSHIKNMAFLTFWPYQDVADSRFQIANFFLSDPLGKFGIELKSEQKLIGTFEIRITESHRSADFGYNINYKYWRQGFATEALTKFVVLAFQDLGFNRVAARHLGPNRASGRVMQRAGLQHEGTLKQSYRKDDTYYDEVLYGLSRDDYLNKAN